MIDGSKKENKTKRQVAFGLQSLRVFEKRSKQYVKGQRYCRFLETCSGIAV